MNSIQLNAQLGALHLQLDASFANVFIVISGENGAGKTTLLRCLAGLEQADGQVQFADQLWLDSSAGFVLPTQQRGLACVWPDAALLPWLSIEKNIVLGSAAVGKQSVDTKSVNMNRLARLAEQFEVSALMQRKPAMLSTGEQQRVALVRAIYRKPAVLLLDEPFSAQAPAIRQRLRMQLKALQIDMAVPVLMVSHDGEDASMLADEHWHMRQGRLLNDVSEHRATKELQG